MAIIEATAAENGETAIRIEDLVAAFCDVLDGITPDDLQRVTGLPDARIARILEIRRQLIRRTTGSAAP